jgi:trigger factor
MNVAKESIDKLNAVVKVNVTKEDYEPKVAEVLKDYRRKASVPGFRPGKVPPQLIDRMYRKPVMADQINKLVSESLFKYIEEQKLSILGDPLPSETQQKPIDWDNDNEFEFAFDLGLSPEFELKVSAKDKVPYYLIQVSDEMLNNYLKNITSRHGEFKPVDVATDSEILRGTLSELGPDGQLLDGGFSTDATLALTVMDDADVKKQFAGAKVGDIISFDLKKAYPNENKCSSILRTTKENLATLGSMFSFTLNSVEKFEEAEINQALFDKVYGEGTVSTEEEFKNKVKEEISGALDSESGVKFRLDVRDKMLDKTSIELPVTFLKRWLVEANRDKKVTVDEIERDWEHFEKDLKWQLIKNNFIKENNFTVTEEEVLDAAKADLLNQYRYYGIANVPDEELTKYAKEFITKRESYQRYAERKLEDKVFAYLKETVKLDQKEVSEDEFKKLAEVAK